MLNGEIPLFFDPVKTHWPVSLPVRGLNAVLGQSNLLPLLNFLDLQGLRCADELLNRDNAPDALDEIERFANKIEIALAVFGQLRLLGKEMHGFAESGGNGFPVFDMLAKRFAKARTE